MSILESIDQVQNKQSEYPIELQSNPIITVIRDPNGPMGKVFSFDENNNVTKKASPSRGEYTAIMYRVETHEDLSNLLKTISEDPNMAIINASFNGIEINETFTILSESKLAKRLNLPEERNQLKGVHTIETNEGSVKLVGRFVENMRPSDWQFFDRDINSYSPDTFADLSLVDWLKQLGELLPETKNVTYALEPSSSSRVLINGVPYEKNNGHLWMKFSRLGDMSNLRKALIDRAEKTNMSWKGPNNRQDTIIDPSVFCVGRIVFTGAPTVADGMEVKPFMMDIVHGTSDSLNASTILPNGKKPELRLSMYLRTENEGNVTIAELLKLICSGDKIKCEAPFRDSSSMAAFISLNPEGKPFIFDSGSSETYWLNDQEWLNFNKDRTLDTVQAMIKRSATDRGAPYEFEASKALNVLARNNHDEYQRALYALKQNGIALVDLKAHLKKRDNSNEDSKDSDGALATKLTHDILSTPRCELLFDANKDPYVRMMVDGVLQTLSVESQGFHDWLAFHAFNKYNSPLRDDVAKQVKQLISANCRFGQKEESKIFMRVGECAGTYYLDLGRPDWSVVCIKKGGWEILTESPIPMYRTSAMQALPLPTKTSLKDAIKTIKKLWTFVNVKDEPSQHLLLAASLEDLRCDTDYILRQFSGTEGSGKSEATIKMRSLIDPVACGLKGAIKDRESLYIAGYNNHILTLNNLSNITPDMQDTLCEMATGGGYSKRTNYTDKGESVVQVKCPVIWNGIPEMNLQGDVIDRMISFELKRIIDVSERKKLDASWEKEHPDLLGALLTIFSESLRILPTIKLKETPRMVSYAMLGSAMYTSLGLDPEQFGEDFKQNKKRALLSAIEGSPAAYALLKYVQGLGDRGKTQWYGSVGALYSLLSEQKRLTQGWPTSVKGLSNILRKSETGLKLIGIEIERDSIPKKDGYYLRIKWQPNSKKPKKAKPATLKKANDTEELLKFMDDLKRSSLEAELEVAIN